MRMAFLSCWRHLAKRSKNFCCLIDAGALLDGEWQHLLSFTRRSEQNSRSWVTGMHIAGRIQRWRSRLRSAFGYLDGQSHGGTVIHDQPISPFFGPVVSRPFVGTNPTTAMSGPMFPGRQRMTFNTMSFGGIGSRRTRKPMRVLTFHVLDLTGVKHQIA
jgi:hypothetical protein